MRFVFRQKLGLEECPYLIRWVFDFGLFSIRLHHWIRSDDTRHLHDHEWNFYSIILKGSLIDRTDEGDAERKWFSITYFPAEHKHSVVVNKSAWSLVLTGPRIRKWGYWVNGKFRKRNKYYFEHGHHNPCE